MTQEELNNLKFGDKIYDKHGNVGVLLCIRSDVSGRAYEIYTENIGNFIYEDVDAKCRLFTTPPKKKVTREISTSVEINHFNDAVEVLFDNQLWNDIMSSEKEILNVTLTYETEE